MTRCFLTSFAQLGCLSRRFSGAFVWTVVGISLHNRYH
jgi:hypothetical protein